MSHYATINCHVLDDVKFNMVQKALKRIDQKYSVELLSKNPNYPKFEDYNAIVTRSNQPTSIYMRFTQNKSKLALSVGGEFYRSGFDAKSFANRLGREYSQLKIEEHARAQHMIPLKRTVKENGDIVLRFRVAG